MSGPTFHGTITCDAEGCHLRHHQANAMKDGWLVSGSGVPWDLCPQHLSDMGDANALEHAAEILRAHGDYVEGGITLAVGAVNHLEAVAAELDPIKPKEDRT